MRLLGRIFLKAPSCSPTDRGLFFDIYNTQHMETLQVTQVQRADTLEALNRSEIDIQISTAKQYPRSVEQSTRRIMALATIDEETAQECFYSLRRGKGENASAVEGPSVRLAEIVAASWGNLRVQSQVVSNDGKFITARGVCHDLETNTAVSCEVQRRITDKNGRMFSDDMIVVTGNAAGAIAFRNAVFKVVPKAVINNTVKAIKAMAMGNSNALEERRNKMLNYFASIGVSKEMVFAYLEVDGIDAIDMEMVMEMLGLVNAIKEGTTTKEEALINPYNERMRNRAATKATGETQSKVAAALQKQA